MSKKMKNIEGFHTIVAGITRQGKSYFVKKTFIPLLVEFKPVIVFDRKHEYSGRNAVDHNSDWIECDGAKGFFKRLCEDEYLERKVYVIKAMDDKDYIWGLKFLQKFGEPVSIVLDEAHDIFLDKDFYDAKKYLVKLVRYGAGFGIDTVLITQRTMDVPPDIRSQFNSAISFKQKHEDDRKVLDKMGFVDADEVLDLDKYHYKIFGREEFPEHINLNEKVAQ